MGTTEQKHPDDEQLTEIVSYLDGELNETQMLAIEQQLINDPDMRSHADILSRTWALLDELDEVSASQRFTQETLAAVSLEASQHPPASNPNRKFAALFAFCSSYKIVPCFLLGFVGGLVGLEISERFFESRQRNPAANTNQLLLDNFELIQRLDAYLAVPNADALELLNLPENKQTPDNGLRP